MQFKVTNELVKATLAAINAEAYTKSIRPDIEAMQMRVLEKNKFQYRDDAKDVQTGEYMTNKKHLYLLSDADFDIYIDEIHELYVNAGFEVKEKGYCPLLVAEENERQANRAMVYASANIGKLAGLNIDDLYSNMKALAKYEDLTKRMVLSNMGA